MTSEEDAASEVRAVLDFHVDVLRLRTANQSRTNQIALHLMETFVRADARPRVQ